MLSLALTFALLSNLTPRQTMYCGLSAALMMMVAFFFSWHEGGASGSTQEGLNLIMASLTLPIFSSVSRQVKEWRDKLKSQKAQLQSMIEVLRVLADQDQLTGLANRRVVNAAILDESARFRRHSRPFCLAIVDVDHFKKINDQFGHEEGDRVLVDLGQYLASKIAAPDLVARWGGEEFVAIFPERTLQDVLPRLEILRAQFVRPVEQAGAQGGVPCAVTMSIGLTEVRAQDDHAAILARADAALYEAKRSGRNRVVRA